MTEFTVGEFEKLSILLNNQEMSAVEKYMEMMISLGLPESAFDEMTEDDLFEFIKCLREDHDAPTEQSRVTIAGHEYVAYDTEFKLTVRDLSLIENAIRKNEAPISTALACIFKRTDLNNTQNYEKYHFQRKMEVFAAEPILSYYTYVLKVAEKVSSKVKTLYANTGLAKKLA